MYMSNLTEVYQNRIKSAKQNIQCGLKTLHVNNTAKPGPNG